MRYILPLIFLAILVENQGVYAQYTETINSNNPGQSQGGFAVGNNVLQFEGGLGYGKENHTLLDTQTKAFAFDYSIRYGLYFEALEISLMGNFVGQNVAETFPDGTEQKYGQNGFPTNTIGLKYLIFDPWKRAKEEKRNLKSWRENHRWKWKYLIPAVSAYAGANLVFSASPYKFETEPPISPKLAVITQSDWKDRWVLVSNIVVDKITTDFPSYEFLITIIHTLNNPKWAVYGEYQGIKSNFYSDYLFRGGTAYMIHKDFQIEADLTFNLKNTPSRLLYSLGASYRLDWHNKDEIIRDKEEESLEDLENAKDLELEGLNREIEELNRAIEGLDEGYSNPETKVKTNRGFQSFEDPEDLENLEQQKKEGRSQYVEEHQIKIQEKQDKKDKKLSKKEAKKQAKLQKKLDKDAAKAEKRNEKLENLNDETDPTTIDGSTPTTPEAAPPTKKKKKKREKRRKLTEEEKEKELNDLDEQIRQLELEFAEDSKKKKKKKVKKKKEKKRTADAAPEEDTEKENIKEEKENDSKDEF